MSDLPNLQDYQKTCSKLLEEPEIRFAGFLDGMGNLVAGGFKKGISPLKDENERKKMFMEAVLRAKTREDFDYNLGPVTYASARRTKVVTMAFPSGKELLFISTEPDVDIDDTAKKIMNIAQLGK